MPSLVGTWRLAETSAVDERGAPLPPPYGPSPMGVLSFTAEGRMIAALCDGRPGLSEEREGREYASYCGSYTFDGTTLVTRVDGASTAERFGTDQPRTVEFDGARLVLRPPPRRVRGRLSYRRLVWERIA
jgi:hypothetical protein